MKSKVTLYGPKSPMLPRLYINVCTGRIGISATIICVMQARLMPLSYSKLRQDPGGGSTWPEALEEMGKMCC